MSDETELYVLPSGRPATKKELLGWDEYCVDSLLLGVWHYIITKRPNNKLGRSTFETWFKEPDVTGNPWEFRGYNGSMTNKELRFYLCDSEHKPEEPVVITGEKIEEADTVVEESDEAVVVEIVREGHKDESKQAPQVIHQTINNFHNYGGGMQAGVLNMASGAVINLGGQKITAPPMPLYITQKLIRQTSIISLLLEEKLICLSISVSTSRTIGY